MELIKLNFMNNCPVCGSLLKTIPAGVSKKTGKPYQSFTACPNKCNTSWNSSPNPPQSPTVKENQGVGEMLVMERIDAINERLDKLISYITKKLG